MHELPQWVLQARERVQAKDPDRLGSVRLIDESARRRGIESISTLQSFALGRVPERGDGWDVEVHQADHGPFIGVGDSLSVSCHGTRFTHIDGLDHVLAHDNYEDGGTTSASALSRWGSGGLIATRGVLVDIPDLRGVPWVDANEPATGAEVDRALERANVTFEAGDALLLYLGRDRFEAAGNTYLPTLHAVDGRPGVGTNCAEWIADHEVGAVAWDFMDARTPDEREYFSVHPLIWAIGLALMDNCNLGPLASAMRTAEKATGFLSVSFPAFEAVTGFPVNPLVVL